MQAHVKTHHIKIDIEGDIPHELIMCLKKYYGKKVKILQDNDEEFVNIFQSDWFRKISEKTSAGDAMKFYRELHGITQEELGEKMNSVSKQNISHMERGTRQVSLKSARKLANIFDVSVGIFIDGE